MLSVCQQCVVCLRCRIAPALLRQASYGTLKIGLYHYLKRLMVERPQGETYNCVYNYMYVIIMSDWKL